MFGRFEDKRSVSKKVEKYLLIARQYTTFDIINLTIKTLHNE